MEKRRPKNITIKPLPTISVPCMKIRWGGTAPAAGAHGNNTVNQIKPFIILPKHVASEWAKFCNTAPNKEMQLLA